MSDPMEFQENPESDASNKSTVGIPLVDMSASVEAIMAQALEKVMTRVTSQLDDCLDTMLEPKVTAVLKKIATSNSAGTSHVMLR